MSFPLKPVCEKKFVRKDGTSLIYIQYCYSTENRILLNTEIAIPPEFWNKKQLQVSEKLPLVYGMPKDINAEVLRLKRLAEDLILFATRTRYPDTPKFVKNTFATKLEIASLCLNSEEKINEINLDIYYQIDEYSRSKERKVCKDMPRIYRNMKEHLKAFEDFRQKPITFETLDLNFYEEFVDFLTFDYVQRRRKEVIKGLKVNTIGKTIKQFRTFLRNRMRKKIIPPIDMDGWTILEEEVDAIYLSISEIKEIYDLDLSRHKYLLPYRNDFVLGCLTGLRFSDFAELQQDDIRKDMLFKKQNKSDHWVVIPLRAEAKNILSERFTSCGSELTNGEFNRHIKTLGKLAGLAEPIKFSHKKYGKDKTEIKCKYEWITSHTCRRSFCTNEFLAGTPVELIMKISGHKSVKDFYKYIRISPEEAGQKIKQLWKERGGMSAFA